MPKPSALIRNLAAIAMYSIALLSFAPTTSRATTLSPILRASTRGVIGEPTDLHLFQRGLIFTPLMNDFLGDTDKLMTGSLKLSYLRTSDDAEGTSFMLSAYWRALTPVFREKIGSATLKQPLGRFADWAEVQLAYSGALFGESRLHYQWLVGLGHIGDKGLKSIHSSVHKFVRLPINELSYHSQPEGLTASLGGELSYPLPLLRLPLLAMAQYRLFAGSYRSAAMFDLYSGVNAASELLGQSLGFELQVSRQLTSYLYDHIRPYRLEATTGLFIKPYILAAVKYVSPYLADDHVRQLYCDFSLHYEF